jgi:FtsH-binding integral membrane protein
MKARVGFIIVAAIGLTVMISIIRGTFDIDRPNLAYCLLMALVFVSLVSVVRSGLDRSIPMSKTSRVIRVLGGSA